MNALDPQDIRRMQNHAGNGPVDQDAVSEFVTLARRAPREKQIKIADTLVGRVLAREPMQHGGKPLTLATMAQIALDLGGQS